MGTKLDELIASLPDGEFKTMLIAFQPSLVVMAKEELSAILARIIGGDTESAWVILIDKARFATVKAELDSLNADWRTFNKKMAGNQQAQRDFLLMAVSIAWTALTLL